VHEAQGHSYFSKESYEEFLWWLQIPRLHKLAGESSPSRKTIADIAKNIAAALATAASAGYRVDAMLLSEKPKAETVS
jgi:hypothetical protein